MSDLRFFCSASNTTLCHCLLVLPVLFGLYLEIKPGYSFFLIWDGDVNR